MELFFFPYFFTGFTFFRASPVFPYYFFYFFTGVFFTGCRLYPFSLPALPWASPVLTVFYQLYLFPGFASVFFLPVFCFLASKAYPFSAFARA
jgi:hypothetical protein